MKVYLTAGAVYGLEGTLGDLEQCARSISSCTSDTELAFLEDQVATAAAQVQQSELQVPLRESPSWFHAALRRGSHRPVVCAPPSLPPCWLVQVSNIEARISALKTAGLNVTACNRFSKFKPKPKVTHPTGGLGGGREVVTLLSQAVTASVCQVVTV